VKPAELFNKANVAIKSSELLLSSGDLDGACNRAYYAMFDAARASLLLTGVIADLASIKTQIWGCQSAGICANLFGKD